MKRILVYGNSGSGKTTLAARLSKSLGAPHLDLDSIAWDEPMVRRSLEGTIALLEEYIAANPAWVIEGCYGDVIAAATRHCSELLFLNPGVEACVASCRARPWERSKYESKEKQDSFLERLIAWVREYETRADEFGLARHRAVFDAFSGTKRELTSREEIARVTA